MSFHLLLWLTLKVTTRASLFSSASSTILPRAFLKRNTIIIIMPLCSCHASWQASRYHVNFMSSWHHDPWPTWLETSWAPPPHWARWPLVGRTAWLAPPGRLPPTIHQNTVLRNISWHYMIGHMTIQVLPDNKSCTVCCHHAPSCSSYPVTSSLSSSLSLSSSSSSSLLLSWCLTWKAGGMLKVEYIQQ